MTRGILFFLAAFPVFAQTPPSADPLPKPNLVVILADDIGAVELGCYGNAKHRTPRLDRLAQEGTRFTTCWVTPLCSPTRVLFMTGQYGFRTGWYNLIGRPFSPPGEVIDPDLPTFADMLKARGYATGLAGKWQLGDVGIHPRTIFDSGFDTYRIWACQGMPPDAPPGLSPRERHFHPAMIQDGKYFPTTEAQYGPDLECDWILDYIRKHRDGPFLAYWPMTLVHEPWDPTPDPGHPGGRTKGGLQANVEYMDRLVGRLLDALQEMNLRETTYILYIGDNGTGKAGKGETIEAGVRVPLIVAGPGVRKGAVTDALVDASDFLPTLAELSGAEPPKGATLDGKSFASVLRGGKDNVREWIFSYLQDGRMLRDGRWLLQGDGRLFDCGTSRDGTGYKDATDSKDPEALAARKRFAAILANLPAPKAQEDASKQKQERQENRQLRRERRRPTAK